MNTKKIQELASNLVWASLTKVLQTIRKSIRLFRAKTRCTKHCRSIKSSMWSTKMKSHLNFKARRSSQWNSFIFQISIEITRSAKRKRSSTRRRSLRRTLATINFVPNSQDTEQPERKRSPRSTREDRAAKTTRIWKSGETWANKKVVNKNWTHLTYKSTIGLRLVRLMNSRIPTITWRRLIIETITSSIRFKSHRETTSKVLARISSCRPIFQRQIVFSRTRRAETA